MVMFGSFLRYEVFEFDEYPGVSFYMPEQDQNIAKVTNENHYPVYGIEGNEELGWFLKDKPGKMSGKFRVIYLDGKEEWQFFDKEGNEDKPAVLIKP